jgi:acetoin utilization deacetylase AcuC-like enzyme
VVTPLAHAFAPQLVLISAGFDAHAEDPLASCQVTDAGFAALTGSMRALSESLGVPFGLVLEGGYALGALARSVAATLEQLVAPSPGSARGNGVAVAPVAAQARARLAASWPDL